MWLFAHQAATGITALLLLWAALLFSQNARWRWVYLAFPVLAVAWAWFGVMVVHDMALAGASGALLLSGVTLWTGLVYWRHWRDKRSSGAILLAWTFWLWGLHHLDYPLLRSLGVAVLYGVFADVLFIVVVALGKLSLVAGESRRALAARTAQLEQLTHLVLRAQEEERRRIARELHDEAGQASDRGQDRVGSRRAQGSERSRRARARPDSRRQQSAAAIGARRSRARTGAASPPARFRAAHQHRSVADLRLAGVACSPQVQVAIYRVVQEALTNVARHSGAKRVHVEAGLEEDAIELVVEDNGRGAGTRGEAAHGVARHAGARHRAGRDVRGQLAPAGELPDSSPVAAGGGRMTGPGPPTHGAALRPRAAEA